MIFYLEDEQRRPRRVPVQRLADPLQGDVRVVGEARQAAPPLLMPEVEVGEARLEVCQVHHLLDAVVQRLGRPLQRAVVEEDEKVEEHLRLSNSVSLSLFCLLIKSSTLLRESVS